MGFHSGQGLQENTHTLTHRHTPNSLILHILDLLLHRTGSLAEKKTGEKVLCILLGTEPNSMALFSPSLSPSAVSSASVSVFAHLAAPSEEDMEMKYQFFLLQLPEGGVCSPFIQPALQDTTAHLVLLSVVVCIRDDSCQLHYNSIHVPLYSGIEYQACKTIQSQRIAQIV